MPPISSVPPQNPQLPGNQNDGDFFVPNTHFNPGQGAQNPRGVDAGATQGHGDDGASSPDGPPGQTGPGGAGHGEHDGQVGGHGGNGPGQGPGDHAGIGNPGRSDGQGGQQGGYGEGGHGGPAGGYQSGSASYGGGSGGLIPGVIADTAHLFSPIASPLFGESSPSGSGAPSYYGESSRPPDQAPAYTTAPSTQALPHPGTLQEATRPPVDSGRTDAAPTTSRSAADASLATPRQTPAAVRPEVLDPRAAQGGMAAQTAAQTQAALLAQQAALMGAMANASLQLAQDPSASAASLAQGNAAATLPEGRELATALRQGVREERDVRDPRNAQQAPADNRRTPSEILAQAFAKAVPDAQTRGNLGDARTPEQRQVDAQTRSDADAKSLRDAADKARNLGTGDASRALSGGEQGRRAGLFSAMAQGGVMAGASESMRQAMDWVGQQVREFGFGSQSGSEGVHAMRVIAGLIAASVVVLVAIAVLYALRVIFVI